MNTEKQECPSCCQIDCICHNDCQKTITELRVENERLKKEFFDMKLLPNEGHCCDGFCGGTCLEGTRLKAQLSKLESALRQCEHNDKTGYDYYGRTALNRFGEAPGQGKCFRTPAEIATEALSTLKEKE